MSSHAHPSLTIVIPAFNEEESIGLTIERCLAAREGIRTQGGVSDVEIIVVSDGSTDRTAEIAGRYAADGSVSVIIFPENRGYGAAIQRGFAEGTGELLGFLDADGTCDPAMFGRLCQVLHSQGTMVAIGSRMGPDSQMPRIRWIGNRLFALLLGLLSGQAVTDTASGMRVLRRDVLADLDPLSHDLDFTPQMSARAMMQRIPISEVPMPYAERLGESKLRAVRDGFRFLRVILDAAICFRPARLLLLGFLFCLATATLLSISPAELYFSHGYLHEWMIYRFIVCLLLGTVGYSLLCSAALTEELLLASPRRKWRGFAEQVLHRLLSTRMLLMTSLVCVFIGLALVWQGFIELATTGHVSIHWSRVIVAAFAVIVAMQSLLTVGMLRFVRLWHGSQCGESAVEPNRSSSSSAESSHAGPDGAARDRSLVTTRY